MRADRLLSILLLLETKRVRTSRELAIELEVSERTIHRDMEALSRMGIPVLSERGAQGGWRLEEAYRSDLTGLNGAEVAALFVPASERHLEDLGLAGTARSAFTKLLASLPAARRRDADRLRERLFVDTTSWRQTSEGVPLFQTLQDAVWQERRLFIRYQRGDGEVRERRVDPLGLVAKGSTWYLVASCDGELRTYRASRIQFAELLSETFARPDGFELQTFWAQSSAAFVSSLPAFRFVGRAAPELLPRLPWVGSFAKLEERDPPEADGWARVVVRVQSEQEAVEFALGLGSRFEILEPTHLREAIALEARRVLECYAPGQDA